MAGTATRVETQPDATEILVERVRFLRHSEARSEYDTAVAALKEADPHSNWREELAILMVSAVEGYRARHVAVEVPR